MSEFAFAENPNEALLAAFRRHGSGVAVITTVSPEGQPVGFTATSITSLGAKPPLVMFSVARGASSWDAISKASHVAVHTLGAKNLELAKRMAADHTQRFVGDDWKFGPESLPIFESATAIIVCKIREVINIEQNAVVIADVVNGSVGEEDNALLYYRRGYHSPGEALS